MAATNPLNTKNMVSITSTITSDEDIVLYYPEKDLSIIAPIVGAKNLQIACKRLMIGDNLIIKGNINCLLRGKLEIHSSIITPNEFNVVTDHDIEYCEHSMLQTRKSYVHCSFMAGKIQVVTGIKKHVPLLFRRKMPAKSPKLESIEHTPLVAEILKAAQEKLTAGVFEDNIITPIANQTAPLYEQEITQFIDILEERFISGFLAKQKDQQSEIRKDATDIDIKLMNDRVVVFSCANQASETSYILGKCYKYGIFYKKDLTLSVDHFEMTLKEDAEHRYALLELATFFKLKQNLVSSTRAQDILEKLVKRGFEKANVELAEGFITGIFPFKEAEARPLFEKFAKQGVIKYQFAMGLHVQSKLISQFYYEPSDYFKMAGTDNPSNGNTDINAYIVAKCFELACIYTKMGGRTNYVISYMNAAAEHGILGKTFLLQGPLKVCLGKNRNVHIALGTGFQPIKVHDLQNLSEIFKFLEKFISQSITALNEVSEYQKNMIPQMQLNLQEARYLQGVMYEMGVGVPATGSPHHYLRLADQLLKESAENGFGPACTRLAIKNKNGNSITIRPPIQLNTRPPISALTEPSLSQQSYPVHADDRINAINSIIERNLAATNSKTSAKTSPNSTSSACMTNKPSSSEPFVPGPICNKIYTLLKDPNCKGDLKSQFELKDLLESAKTKGELSAGFFKEALRITATPPTANLLYYGIVEEFRNELGYSEVETPTLSTIGEHNANQYESFRGIDAHQKFYMTLGDIDGKMIVESQTRLLFNIIYRPSVIDNATGRKKNLAIIITKGLCKYAGMELMAEAWEDELGSDPLNSWLYDCLKTVAVTAKSYGMQFSRILKARPYSTVPVRSSKLPFAVLDSRTGDACVILGVNSPTVPKTFIGPDNKPIEIVTVRLLTVNQWADMLFNKGKDALVAQFASEGTYHVSSIKPTLVAPPAQTSRSASQTQPFGSASRTTSLTRDDALSEDDFQKLLTQLGNENSTNTPKEPTKTVAAVQTVSENSSNSTSAANNKPENNATTTNTTLPAVMPVVQNTLNDGDCAFHAIFGQFNAGPNMVICNNVETRRQTLARAIKDCNERSAIFDLVVNAIQDLVMRKGTELRTLRDDYGFFLKQNSEIIDNTWNAFAKELQDKDADGKEKYAKILEFINQQTKDNSKLTKFEDKFKACLNMKEDTLRKDILAQESLKKLFEEYTKATIATYDFKSKIAKEPKLIAEYAAHVGKAAQWLLPCEIQIIAMVFDLRIEFYSYNIALKKYANPEIYNPKGNPSVQIRFDGNIHFEKMVPEAVAAKNNAPASSSASASASASASNLKNAVNASETKKLSEDEIFNRIGAAVKLLNSKNYDEFYRSAQTLKDQGLLNKFDRSGLTLAHFAATKEAFPALLFLMDLGMDLDKFSRDETSTPNSILKLKADRFSRFEKERAAHMASKDAKQAKDVSNNPMNVIAKATEPKQANDTPKAMEPKQSNAASNANEPKPTAADPKSLKDASKAPTSNQSSVDQKAIDEKLKDEKLKKEKEMRDAEKQSMKQFIAGQRKYALGLSDNSEVNKTLAECSLLETLSEVEEDDWIRGVYIVFDKVVPTELFEAYMKMLDGRDGIRVLVDSAYKTSNIRRLACTKIVLDDRKKSVLPKENVVVRIQFGSTSVMTLTQYNAFAENRLAQENASRNRHVQSHESSLNYLTPLRLMNCNTPTDSNKYNIRRSDPLALRDIAMNIIQSPTSTTEDLKKELDIYLKWGKIDDYISNWGTLLHFAAKESRIDMFVYLEVHANANPHLPMYNNKTTPIEILKQRGLYRDYSEALDMEKAIKASMSCK